MIKRDYILLLMVLLTIGESNTIVLGSQQSQIRLERNANMDSSHISDQCRLYHDVKKIQDNQIKELSEKNMQLLNLNKIGEDKIAKLTTEIDSCEERTTDNEIQIAELQENEKDNNLKIRELKSLQLTLTRMKNIIRERDKQLDEVHKDLMSCHARSIPIETKVPVNSTATEPNQLNMLSNNENQENQLEALQFKVDNYENIIKQKSNQLLQLSFQTSLYNSISKQHEKKIKEIEGELNLKDSIIKNLKQQLQVSTTEANQQPVNRTQEEILDAHPTTKTEMQILKTKIISLEATVNNTEAQLEKLKYNTTSCNRLSMDQEKSMGVLKDIMASLNNTIKEKESDHSVLLSKISSCEAVREQKEKQIKKQEIQLNESKRNFASSEGIIREKDNKIRELQNITRSNAININTCNSQRIDIESLKRNITSCSTIINSQNNQMTQLNLNIKKSAEIIADWESKYRSNNGELKKCNNQLKILQERKSNNEKNNIEDLRRTINKYNSERTDLASNIEFLNNQITKLKLNVSDCANTTKNQEIKLTHCESILKEKRNLNKVCNDELRELNNSLAKKNDIIEKSQNKTNQLETFIQFLKKKSNNYELERAGLESTITRLNSSLNRIEDEKRNMENEITELRNIKTSLSSNVTQLQILLNNCTNIQSNKEKKGINITQKNKLNQNRPKQSNLPNSCLSIPHSNKIQKLEVHDILTIRVICDSTYAGTGWTVIQRRVNGSQRFNNTWFDYENGFGDLKGNFFIGLKNLYRMTKSQKHELYIVLNDKNNIYRYARYDYFEIGGKSVKYKLKYLGTHTGNFGKLLVHSLNMSFSTYDSDNDMSPTSNCAGKYKGGWWYSGCGSFFLNGEYDSDGVYYMDQVWKKYVFMQMMIRPIRGM